MELATIAAEKRAATKRLLQELDRHLQGSQDHAQRVAVYATATGEALGLPDADLEKLYLAALLHDVGKLAIDADLLGREGPVEDHERAELMRHAEAFAVCEPQESWMRALDDVIRAHHERWDGEGYPDGLSGDSIPILARILAVAEVFDTVAFGAFWRAASGEDEAAEEIRRLGGTWFDPNVVDAFMRVQPLIQPVIA